MSTFKIEQTDSQCVATWRYHDSSVFIGFILLAVLTIVVTLLTHLLLWGLVVFFVALAVHTWSGKTKIVLNADGITSAYTNLIRKREERIAHINIRCFKKQIRYNHGKLSSAPCSGCAFDADDSHTMAKVSSAGFFYAPIAPRLKKRRRTIQ